MVVNPVATYHEKNEPWNNEGIDIYGPTAKM